MNLLQINQKSFSLAKQMFAEKLKEEPIGSLKEFSFFEANDFPLGHYTLNRKTVLCPIIKYSFCIFDNNMKREHNFILKEGNTIEEFEQAYNEYKDSHKFKNYDINISISQVFLSTCKKSPIVEQSILTYVVRYPFGFEKPVIEAGHWSKDNKDWVRRRIKCF